MSTEPLNSVNYPTPILPPQPVAAPVQPRLATPTYGGSGPSRITTPTLRSINCINCSNGRSIKSNRSFPNFW